MLQKLQKVLSQGGFVRNVLTLMTGTTIAQAIPIAISPILTRLYTPKDFGVLAVFLSVTAMIGVISTGRYELAIMLPNDDKDGANLVVLSLIVDGFVSFFAFFILWFFHAPITRLLNTPEISHWLYMIPISVFLTGLYQSFNYWSNRRKQYKRLARSRVSKSFGTGIFNIGAGLTTTGSFGLIGGEIFGQMLSSFVLGYQIYREDKELAKWISKEKIKENARRYQDFPKINSLHAFSDYFQQTLIITLITSFFGNTVLGFYSFTMRILRAPLGLIGASVAQVFFQKASETYNRGESLQPLVKKTMIQLSMIALPIFAIILLFAPHLFGVLFGMEWKEAGRYAQLLSPWLFLSFVTSPISQVPIIVNKQKSFFLISLFGNSLMVLSILLVGYLKYSIYVWFYFLIFLQTLYMGFVIFWILKVSKTRVVIDGEDSTT
ncbi:lipopolysaccharide biosynthesis protein [Tepidibacillus sp. LV47]|uniref:lipopolysaccharide biosynthesis protein n=1 Tax=Tepidibacillus sp. LV47 TaxID=3398228 RepID=UPI003AAD9B07